MSNVVKQEALLHVAHYGDGFDDDPGFEVSSGGNLFAGKTRISFDGTNRICGSCPRPKRRCPRDSNSL